MLAMMRERKSDKVISSRMMLSRGEATEIAASLRDKLAPLSNETIRAAADRLGIHFATDADGNEVLA